MDRYRKTIRFLLFFILSFVHGLHSQETILPYGNFQAILDFINPLMPENPIIVEAGAHHGRDTLMMLKQWPLCKLYVFEPIPRSYARLIKNTHQYNNIRCFQSALSDKNGTAQLFVSQNSLLPTFATQESSLLQPTRPSNSSSHKQITVNTTTLDAWAQEQAVSWIDFLWLNIQGLELPVLMASPEILKNTRILALEVEFVELYKQQHLHDDVKKWVIEQGFELVARNFETCANYKFGDIVFIRKKS
jgi:FkbM family methyltransferase